MDWDLGAMGLGWLLALAVGFGVVVQIVAGRGSVRWLWAVGAASFALFGALISEGWFGWATEEDLQPNYDGLSLDETLLAVLPSVVVVVVVQRAISRRRAARGSPAVHRGRPA